MVMIYTIPATGHIYAMLAVMEALVQQGYKVAAYASQTYREEIEAIGAQFLLYPFDESKIDLKDGSRILKFRRLVLEQTVALLPQLMREAQVYKPALILHDAAAHWGKRIGESLQVPSVSFCSFISVGKRISIATLLYACNFLLGTIKDLNELFVAHKYSNQLRNCYGYQGFDPIDVLLSHEKLNIISYSHLMQPGSSGFGKTYFFLGPSATLRRTPALEPVAFSTDKRKLYCSMGTIMNADRGFYQWLFPQLFDTDYEVYISDGSKVVQIPLKYKGRFFVRPFFNQAQMLQNVDLFLTAGGINSVCESIRAGVPCLMFPQQGEQKLCCERTQRLGYGKIAKLSRPLGPQIEQALSLKKSWDYEKADKITTVHMDELMEKLEKQME